MTVAASPSPLQIAPDGKRHLHLLTASRMKEYRACPRRHYYSYVLQVRPKRAAEALVMGTWFHKGCETYWRARMVSQDLHDCARKAMAALQKIAESEGDNLDQALFTRSRVMVAAYVATWNTRPGVQPLAVEQSFLIPHVAPDGRVSDFWMLSGKMDLIARFEDGVVRVVEHKSSAADIDAGGDYRRRLTLDEQISVYLKAAKILGFPAQGIVYDVTRKSRKRPLKATPEDKREFTKEKSRVCKECKRKKNNIPGPHFYDQDGEFCVERGEEQDGIYCANGRVVTDPGGALKSSQRLADETMQEYEERLKEDGIGSMVEIVEIHRIGKEMDKFDENLRDISRLMRMSIEHNMHPQNSDACFQYHGSPCAYIGVCEGTVSIDDPYVFKKLDTAHPELEDDNGAKEID